MIEHLGKYFLYRHIRLDKNEPFYIGVGTKKGNPLRSNIAAYTRANKPDGRSNYWFNITENIEYEIDILLESNDRDFIFEKEKEFISLYGRKINNTGTLVNIEEGGLYAKRERESIIKTIETKKKRGNLGNATNLRAWIQSDRYKNPKARCVYLYSSENGELVDKFNSFEKCLVFLGRKGSVSYLLEICDTSRIYKNKYILYSMFLGDCLDLSKYNFDKCFYKPVSKICPNTKKVIEQYDSMSEAAKKNGVTLKNISESVIRKTGCLGFYWVLSSNISNIENIKFSKIRYSKIVRIDKNGAKEYFNGSRELAKIMGVHKSTILRVIHSEKELNGYKIYFCGK